MPARKKRRKKTAKKTKRYTVSRAALVKVIHLGASHHAALAALKKTVRVGMTKRKKAAKKTTRRRRKKR
jgi:hypothetical protein